MDRIYLTKKLYIFSVTKKITKKNRFITSRLLMNQTRQKDMCHIDDDNYGIKVPEEIESPTGSHSNFMRLIRDCCARPCCNSR